MVCEKPRCAGQVLLIPSERIFPNPNQPRKIFDQGELVNLAISIRMNGILQPITVREVENGYEVVSGERRLRASKLAGMLVVPCIVVDINAMKSAVFSLIENLQRQDLNFFEEAVAVDELMRKYSLTQEEAAKMLGKAPCTVSNKLRLLNLPQKVQKLILENALSERHARALLRLDEKSALSVLEKVIERHLNVTQTEKLVEAALAEQNKPRRTTKRMFSDIKIFLNTISNAVSTMHSAGINADFTKSETEECFVYQIVIPKSGAYAVKTEKAQQTDRCG